MAKAKVGLNKSSYIPGPPKKSRQGDGGVLNTLPLLAMEHVRSIEVKVKDNVSPRWK